MVWRTDGAFASAGLVRQGRGRLILEIDVGKLLAVVVAHDEAGTFVKFFDRPRRGKSALRHTAMRTQQCWDLGVREQPIQETICSSPWTNESGVGEPLAH